MQHGNKAPNGCNLSGANCENFHPKMCHSSLTKGVCYQEDFRLKHVNGTQRSPTARPETGPKRRQERRKGNQTTEQPRHAQGTSIPSTPNDFLDAIRLLKQEMMEAIDLKLAMAISQEAQRPARSTVQPVVTSQMPMNHGGVLPQGNAMAPGMPAGMPMIYPTPGSPTPVTPGMYLPVTQARAPTSMYPMYMQMGLPPMRH